MTARTAAASKSTAYSYSPDGKLLSRTWARKRYGQPVVATCSYDDFSQLQNVHYSDNTPAISFTYNRLGQLQSVADALGNRSFSYNAQFSLQQEAISGNYTRKLNYTYTNSGFKGRSLGMSIGSANLLRLRSVRSAQ